CQASSARCALTGNPPFGGDPTTAPFGRTRGFMSASAVLAIANVPAQKGCSARVAGLAVVDRRALERLDLEEQAVDRHDPDLLAGLDRRRPVRAGPPGGVPHGDDTL